MKQGKMSTYHCPVAQRPRSFLEPSTAEVPIRTFFHVRGQVRADAASFGIDDASLLQFANGFPPALVCRSQVRINCRLFFQSQWEGQGLHALSLLRAAKACKRHVGGQVCSDAVAVGVEDSVRFQFADGKFDALIRSGQVRVHCGAFFESQLERQSLHASSLLRGVRAC